MSRAGAAENYQRTQMKKETVLRKLKEQGCRITRQRQMLVDIILAEDCTSCKEIYYKASRQDPGIGRAAVYRMVNTLESVGAISRRGIYKLACEPGEKDYFLIELDDNTEQHLTKETMNTVLLAGLKACGYVEDQKVRNVKSISLLETN